MLGGRSGPLVLLGVAVIATTLVPARTAQAEGFSPLPSVAYQQTVFDEGNFDPATQGPADGMQGLQDVVVTPDGKHLYASGGNDDAIASFAVGADGSLTYLATVFHTPTIGIDAVRNLAVSPDGKHLYAASVLSNSVAVFSRNASTGALIWVHTLFDDVGGVTGLGGAKAVTVSPDGRQVYVGAFADDAVAVFDRDGTTGVLTPSQTLFDGVGGVDGLDSVDDIVVSPDGKHVYVVSGKSLPNLTQGDDAIAAFARDTDPISPTFGELTFIEALFDGVGGVDSLHEVAELDISPDGKHIYTAAETDGAIGSQPADDWLGVFARNATTGRLTFVEAPAGVDRPECGITFFGSSASDVKVAADGQRVFAVDPRENALVEFLRNPTTGLLTNAHATCSGAARGGSDFENEILSGLLIPTALAIAPSVRQVFVGAFSPAAVTVFGQPGVIEIRKNTVPDAATDFRFDLAWAGGSVLVGPLDDDANPTNPSSLPIGTLEAGTYTITERVVAGYAVTGITCSDPSGGTTTNVGQRRATVSLAPGETVVCTFRNEPVITCNGLAATIIAAPGQVAVNGTNGDDVIVGNELDNLIDAKRGDDTVCSLGGDDSVNGGAGNDTILGGKGSDSIRGGPGDDLLMGQGGGDTFRDGPGNDIVIGGPGNDVLIDDTGSDVFKGGPGGADMIDARMAPSGVEIDLGKGKVTRSRALMATVSGVERARGSKFDDVIIGNGARNLLKGAAGKDRIDGRGHNDVLVGGPGDDTLLGRAGDDRLIGGTGDDSLNGGPGTDVLKGGPGKDVCRSGETSVCETVL